MKNYVHKKLKINTLSYCIISPREPQAFYAGIDFDKELGGELKGTNIIYPSYRYGTYDIYNPDKAEYYIPGSSIKGSLLRTAEKDVNDIRKQLMVDDIVLECGQIKLKKIWKYQNIHNDKNNSEADSVNNKKIEYQIFFQNVAFEMLIPNISLTTDIYIAEGAEEQLKKILIEIDRNTKKQLDDYAYYLSDVEKLMCEKEANLQDNEKNKFNNLKDRINQQKNNVKAIKDNNYLMSLGGYKGILRSLKADIKMDKGVEIDKRGALFIDNETDLPYGIVKVNIE